MTDELVYIHSDSLLADSQQIIEAAQQTAYRAVNEVLVRRNWLLGKRIAEENMNGTRIERYGAKTITDLADQLTNQYGKGFDKRALYRFVKFYQLYPEIMGTVSPQSLDSVNRQIVGTTSPQSCDVNVSCSIKKQLLSWSHYERLIQVLDPDARAWYEKKH